MSIATTKMNELSVENFVTSGTNNNFLVFHPIPYAKQSSSAIDDVYTINGITTIEIVEADLDVALTGSNYAFSVGTDNKIKLAFSKALHTTKASALAALKSIEIQYLIGNLTLDGANYTLIARDSSGVEFHRTTPVTLEKATQIISTLDMSRDTKREGFVVYELTHNFINN
ncbi:hypothetical protein NV379_02630 [Paenibacillus sp. N1-5-1-14]|uniref:hypothetical protein n=1 Tax=Paenibacillus radicibacter TaxID=2972488 RepID=UPI002158A529|nr:hypothetical protein [Paenibacillus radicibacter]MCR8641542.1 hypothetical protein [Paenibacillus radicibacter]